MPLPAVTREDVRPAGAEAASAFPAVGYSSFVLPEHPFVRDLVAGATGETRSERLIWVLSRASERLRYRSLPGRRSFAALSEDLGRNPERPPEANCLTLCCALASALRRVELTADEVFVALGSVRGVGHFHAWLLVPDGDRFYWVDPAHLVPRRMEGAEIARLHHLHAVFNDRRMIVDRSDKARLLAAGRLPRPRMVIFGRNNPHLDETLGDDRFRDLVTELLYTAGSVLHSAHGLDTERFETAGMLIRDGERLLPGPRLVIIPAQPLEDLRDAAKPWLDRYTEVVREVVPRIRERFGDTHAAGRFGWGDVEHALVVGSLMDLAVGRELAIRGEGLRHGVEGVIWAFGGGPVRNAVGVQQTADPATGWMLAQLWHCGFQREDLALAHDAIRALGDRWQGTTGPSDPRVTLYLQYRGLLLRGERGFPESAVPGFDASEWADLSTLFGGFARRLVLAAVLPALEWSRCHPWWRVHAHRLEVRHAVLRVLLEQAVDAVVENRVVSPFPSAVDLKSNWGRWLRRAKAG